MPRRAKLQLELLFFYVSKVPSSAVTHTVCVGDMTGTTSPGRFKTQRVALPSVILPGCNIVSHLVSCQGVKVLGLPVGLSYVTTVTLQVKKTT